MAEYGLELTAEEQQTLERAVLATAKKFDDHSRCLVSSGPVVQSGPLIEALHASPPEEAGNLDRLLGLTLDAVEGSANASGPLSFGHIPGSSLWSSVFGEFLSRATNRHTAFSTLAPGLAAMEQSVLRWLCRVFDLPLSSGGTFTTGASHSTITALAAARMNRLGDDFHRGTIYLTPFTHNCAYKSLRVIGIRRSQIRVVPADDNGRMDVGALRSQVERDRQEGWQPFLLTATAGYTDTGVIDPLVPMAELARQQGLWLHVDAAYGGFFQLTRRGREALKGIECADSIVLDPHKGLFLPFGTGALLVRDISVLKDAYETDAAYLRDMDDHDHLLDRADIGTELTVEFRGLRVWLPLHLHGISAFREALDEKLDLAQDAHESLSEEPSLVLGSRELSTVVFRASGGDHETEELFTRINSSGFGTLSTTVIDGKLMIRMCILNNLTHAEHVRPLVTFIRDTARRISSAVPNPRGASSCSLERA